MRHNLVCETFRACGRTVPMIPFASRLDSIETSAIRELFKVLGKPGIISFAGGFPDPQLFDVEGLRMASEQALADGDAARSLQYAATEGVQPLREQLALRMAQQDMPVAADQMLVTTGCQQALDSTAKCLINPGDKVLVEAPTFLAAIQCFKVYGADVKGVPTDAQGVDVDALEQAIVQHQPKMVYLIPNFSNPTGAMLGLQRRQRIVELAAKYQVMVVEDDPYGALYFDAPPPPALYALAMQAGVEQYVVYCGSLSKILSPGLRVGWMVAAPELLAKATMCKQFTDAHTSSFTQMVAAHYLQSGRLPQAVERMRATYAQRAQAMAATLTEVMGDKLTFATPQGGMFLWATMQGAGADNGAANARLNTTDATNATNATNTTNATEYAQRAVQQNVAFVPGAPFFADHPVHATFRLSYATASEADIAEGVQRMAAAW